MKRLSIFLLVIFICIPAFAIDITSTYIFGGGIVDKQTFVPQISGDIWLKYSDLDILTADLA